MSGTSYLPRSRCETEPTSTDRVYNQGPHRIWCAQSRPWPAGCGIAMPSLSRSLCVLSYYPCSREECLRSSDTPASLTVRTQPQHTRGPESSFKRTDFFSSKFSAAVTTLPHTPRVSLALLYWPPHPATAPPLPGSSFFSQGGYITLYFASAERSGSVSHPSNGQTPRTLARDSLSPRSRPDRLISFRGGGNHSNINVSGEPSWCERAGGERAVRND